MTQLLTFQVGASVTCDKWSIEDRPKTWELLDGIPTCLKCGQLNLTFDMPNREGIAVCKCVEDLGGSMRRQLLRNFLRIE